MGPSVLFAHACDLHERGPSVQSVFRREELNTRQLTHPPEKIGSQELGSPTCRGTLVTYCHN